MKSILRKQLKKELSFVSEQTLIAQSNLICEHLTSTPLWKQSKLIAITISKDKEVHTYPIIQKAWKEQKQIAVPRSNFQSKEMDFYILTNFDQLEKRQYGLMEPVVDVGRWIDPKSIDLMVVPGLAFSYDGKRLGYGGGFFDRYLKKTSSKTVSLALSCQLVNDIPTEAHDITINQIITAEGVLNNETR